MNQRRKVTSDYSVCPGCGADLTEDGAVYVEKNMTVKGWGRWEDGPDQVSVYFSDAYGDKERVFCDACTWPLRAKVYQNVRELKY